MKQLYSLLIVAALTITVSQQANAQASMSDSYTYSYNPKPQLAPNPAHSFIKVAWQQLQAGNVLMQLYTQSGTLVSTLCNQNYVVGEHGRSVNLSGTPRGTFMFRLTMPGRSWSTTLVIQ